MPPERKLDENIDEFAAAFDDALADVPQTPPETPPAEPNLKPVEPPAEIPAEPTAPAAPPMPPVAEPVGGTPATPSADISALQTQITDLTAELAALKAGPQTAATDAAAAAITEELKWLNEEFSADWPDIAKAINIAVKAALGQADGKLKTVTDAVTPLVQQAKAQVFFTELQKLVPDIETVRDGFIGWIKTQPPAIRDSYTSIVETGTAVETAALINMYKQLTNVPPVQPAATTPSASARLRNMEDIGSRKTAITHSSQAIDFDNAFAEAANDPSIK